MGGLSCRFTGQGRSGSKQNSGHVIIFPWNKRILSSAALYSCQSSALVGASSTAYWCCCWNFLRNFVPTALLSNSKEPKLDSIAFLWSLSRFMVSFWPNDGLSKAKLTNSEVKIRPAVTCVSSQTCCSTILVLYGKRRGGQLSRPNNFFKKIKQPQTSDRMVLNLIWTRKYLPSRSSRVIWRKKNCWKMHLFWFVEVNVYILQEADLGWPGHQEL